MKYCPTCQTKYDEEILRFCTKDGSPLIEETQPNFTELPSESEDYGEETVIRRKTPAPVAQPDPEAEVFTDRSDSQRIVISTDEAERQQVRPKTTPSPRDLPPPRESNTAVVVLLTIIGTVVVMTSIIGIVWIFSNQSSSDINANLNTNVNALDENLNANLDNMNGLFDPNANLNSNIDTNLNLNANVKTPTPTPTPSPTATPTPDESNSNTNAATPTPRPTSSPRPSPTVTATPPASPTQTPVNMGILNDRAVNLQKPSYPQIAREMRASGPVRVQVVVDEKGNVNSAKAVSGHPLLRSTAENAAKNSKFTPAKVSGRNVKATGVLVYNFIRPN